MPESFSMSENKYFVDKYLKPARQLKAFSWGILQHFICETIKVSLKCNCEITLCASATAVVCERKYNNVKMISLKIMTGIFKR